MAKKKKGTSIGLILTLIFFVLTTFAGGTLAYFGYTEQDQFKKDAEAAKKDKATIEQQLRVEQNRALVYKIAIGVDDGEDRRKLISGMLDDESRRLITREYQIIVDKFTPQLPSSDDFTWTLITMDPAKIKEKTKDYDAETALQRLGVSIA